MKKIIKISMLLMLLLIALMLNPNFSNAATDINSEEALRDAITNATEDEVIELSADISLKKPIEINNNKDITINGNGHTITKDAEGWSREGENGTLITAGGKGSVITLKNLKLTDADKYGVQAYNGGQVVLDNVTISNCAYGAVLVNAGTVEVKDLTLNRNGGEKNNGIEIAKGKSVNTGDNMPTLLMNGTLNSTETENVVYIAINDNLSTFEVQNSDSTTNKIFAYNNKVVITDENNVVLYESNTTDKAVSSGDQYTDNVLLTVNIEGNIIEIMVEKGTVLSMADLEEKFNLADLELSEYKIDGYYTDSDFTDVFDFEDGITADTEIYVKLSLIQQEPETTPAPEITPTPEPTPETTPAPEPAPETTPAPTTPVKDETPKTGFESHVEIAFSLIAVSLIGLVVLNKIRS